MKTLWSKLMRMKRGGMRLTWKSFLQSRGSHIAEHLATIVLDLVELGRVARVLVLVEKRSVLLLVLHGSVCRRLYLLHLLLSRGERAQRRLLLLNEGSERAGWRPGSAHDCRS